MVSLGKSFGYAKKSVMAYIGIWAVVVAITFAMGSPGSLLGVLQFFIINPILLAYAGYMAGKSEKGDIVAGASSGAVGGFVASFIVGVLSFALSLAGMGAVETANQGALGAGAGAIIAGVVLVAQIMMVIGITVAGAVLGAIGAVIAGSQSKKK